MRGKTKLACLAAALGLTCGGCAAGATGATATASKPTVVFPSRDELARIPAKEARAEAFGMEDVPVESWSFEAQASSDAAAYDDASPWGELVRELVKSGRAQATPSAPLRCAAQEMARFHARNGALPTESLRRFVTARCGAVTSGVAPSYWTVTSPAPIPDAELVAKVREGLARQLAARGASVPFLLGLAAAREGQRTSVVALVSHDEARLEPGSLQVDDHRKITLRGAARGDFETIGALINRGDVGTATCTPDPQVKPPRFALTCELAQGDRFAWVELLGRRHGEILVHELAETLVTDGDRGALTYTARHVGPPAPVKTGQDFSRALLDGLNHVRAGANMTPLQLAAKQSAENARLAGTLVDSMAGRDDGVANRAAIGLMAGWEVQGLVKRGDFFVAAVGTSDATAWLDFALEHPMGRSSLLDPAMRVVAIGPTIPPGGGALGAALTTYALFGAENHSNEATRFFQKVVAARAARGLPAPERLQGLGEMEVELARVARDDESPMEALQATMQLAVSNTGQSARGYTLETSDVEQLPVPEVLLAAGPLRVMVGVTHHRAQGAAWGQYVVVLVVVGGK